MTRHRLNGGGVEWHFPNVPMLPSNAVLPFWLNKVMSTTYSSAPDVGTTVAARNASRVEASFMMKWN